MNVVTLSPVTLMAASGGANSEYGGNNGQGGGGSVETEEDGDTDAKFNHFDLWAD